MFSHPDVYVNAIGALLTGLGAVLSACFGYRAAAKRHDDDCDKRVKEIMNVLKMGMTLEERSDDEDRWSHLP